jgi:hypothetical protein
MRKPAPAEAAAWAAPAPGLAVLAAFYLPVRRYLGVESPNVARLAADGALRALGVLHGRWPGLSVPLLDGFKHGPGDWLFTVPFVLLLGSSPAAIFWRNGAAAGAAIATTCLLGRALYRDRWAAAAGGLILATSPGFVLYSMLGGLTGATVTALVPACLYFLLRFADERKPRLAYLGIAALALALDCRSTAAAFLLGLAAYVWLDRRALAALLPPPGTERRKFAARGAAVFAAVLSPFAAACAARPREFLAYWSARLVVREEAGSNLDYASNLVIRLRHAWLLLKDGDGLRFFVADPDRYPGTSGALLAAALLASGGWLLVRSLRGKEFPRRWLLPWVVMLVFLLVSPFSPSRLRVMHLFPLLPLACLAACSGIAAAPPRMRPAILAALLAFSAARARAEYVFFRIFYADLARAGVWDPNLSTAALDLAGWFAKRPEATPVLFGGPAAVLHFVSGGAIPAIEFQPEAAPSPRAAWDGVLGIKDVRFVVVVDPGGVFDESGARAALRREASRRGRSAELEETLRRPDGSPVFEIYRLTGVRRR